MDVPFKGVTIQPTYATSLNFENSSICVFQLISILASLDIYCQLLNYSHYIRRIVGEGNGNPLQCSCLENPGDGGAWWAAVYGVAQSWTQLKRLSSSKLCKLA